MAEPAAAALESERHRDGWRVRRRLGDLSGHVRRPHRRPRAAARAATSRSCDSSRPSAGGSPARSTWRLTSCAATTSATSPSGSVMRPAVNVLPACRCLRARGGRRAGPERAGHARLRPSKSPPVDEATRSSRRCCWRLGSGATGRGQPEPRTARHSLATRRRAPRRDHRARRGRRWHVGSDSVSAAAGHRRCGRRRIRWPPRPASRGSSAGPDYVLVASPMSAEATSLPIRAPFLPWLSNLLSQRLTREGSGLMRADPGTRFACRAGVTGFEGDSQVFPVGATATAPIARRRLLPAPWRGTGRRAGRESRTGRVTARSPLGRRSSRRDCVRATSS